jgi:rhodanese-related sulfurtransferase
MNETPDPPHALCFHVDIDDGGGLLAVASDRIVIGHLRSSAADLRFLADVEAEHARLLRRDSFHAGPSWQIERASARELRVNGRAVESTSIGLFDGDEVELARNLAFRFREPQASSHSAVLELSRGAECEGALRVLLFAPGESGVVRIGSKRDRHIPLADIEHEISLKLTERELWVHCAGGVRRQEGAATGESSTTLALECPPTRPEHLACRARSSGRAPLWVSLRPISNSKERA